MLGSDPLDVLGTTAAMVRAVRNAGRKNNSGRGVGGSMVHYAGYTPGSTRPTS